MQIQDAPIAEMQARANQCLDDVESMLGGANGPTIRIRAVLDFLFKENFTLAAGQCPNATVDEGGTPRCAALIEAKNLLLEVSASRWECATEDGACPDCGCDDGEPHDEGCLLGRVDAAIDGPPPPLPKTAREIDDALAGLWPPVLEPIAQWVHPISGIDVERLYGARKRGLSHFNAEAESTALALGFKPAAVGYFEVTVSRDFKEDGRLYWWSTTASPPSP
jgi:hypothetical protein